MCEENQTPLEATMQALRKSCPALDRLGEAQIRVLALVAIDAFLSASAQCYKTTITHTAINAIKKQGGGAYGTQA